MEIIVLLSLALSGAAFYNSNVANYRLNRTKDVIDQIIDANIETVNHYGDKIQSIDENLPKLLYQSKELVLITRATAEHYDSRMQSLNDNVLKLADVSKENVQMMHEIVEQNDSRTLKTLDIIQRLRQTVVADLEDHEANIQSLDKRLKIIESHDFIDLSKTLNLQLNEINSLKEQNKTFSKRLILLDKKNRALKKNYYTLLKRSKFKKIRFGR